MTASARDIVRISTALEAARDALAAFDSGPQASVAKGSGEPVTEADLAVNAVLHRLLPEANDAWLSEESKDDPERLRAARVWVVDPIDGTREFVEGIPEWCVSVGLVENGIAIAGGILAPSAGFLALGALGHGVFLNGSACRVRERRHLSGAEVLASRSEVRRGEWQRFEGKELTITPFGSVAFKLARVAAGLCDATWTLVPKHEWDVAAGVALVVAAGGEVWTRDGAEPRFNRPVPKFEGLLAAARGLREPITELIARCSRGNPGSQGSKPG